MKTISELNEHWWYRLVKIIIIFTLVFFVFKISENIIEQFSPSEGINIFASNVTCLTGNKTIHSFAELRSTFDEFALSSKTLNPKIIAGLCELKDPFGDNIPSGTSIFEYMSNTKANQYLKNPEVVLAWEKEISSNYSVNEIRSVTGSWSGVAMRILIVIVIALLLTETLRRIFYYIILGSLKPLKKKHESDTILP